MLKLLAILLLLLTTNQTIQPLPTRDENEVKRLLVIYTNANQIDWNTDGSRIVTANLSEIRLWDAETLEQLYATRHSQLSNGVLFSPNGDLFLAWSNNEIRIWEADSGELRGGMRLNNGNLKGVDWYDDQILYWVGSTVNLWDGVTAEGGKGLFINGEDMGPFRSNLSLKRDKTRFLTWNAIEVPTPVVRIWQIEGEFESLTQVMLFEHGDERIEGAAWSPDETMIVSWSQNAVKIWDAATGELLHSVNENTYVTNAEWSPNSRYVLVEDIREQKARLWDAQSGDEILTLTDNLDGTNAMWDTTGDRMLVGRQTIKLLDVATGESLAEFGPSLGLGIAKWNADGIRLLVDTAFGVQVWIIPPQDQCVVHALSPANLRMEADVDSELVGQLPPHKIVTVTDQKLDEDSFLWWQLESGAWVRSDIVLETGNCSTMG